MNVLFIVSILTNIISLITNTESYPRWTPKPIQDPWLRHRSEESSGCARGQCVQSFKCPPQAISKESSDSCEHWGHRSWVCCIVDHDENHHSDEDYHLYEDNHNPQNDYDNPRDHHNSHVDNHNPQDHHHNPHEDHHHNPHEDHHNPHEDHHHPNEGHHNSDHDHSCETHVKSTIKPHNAFTAINNWNYKTTRNVGGTSSTNNVHKWTTPNPYSSRTNKPKTTYNPRIIFPTRTPTWTTRTTKRTTTSYWHQTPKAGRTTMKPWGQPTRTTRSSNTRGTSLTTRAVWSGTEGRKPSWLNQTNGYPTRAWTAPAKASTSPARVWTAPARASTSPTRSWTSPTQSSVTRVRVPATRSTIRSRERVTTPLPNVNTYSCGIRQRRPNINRRSKTYNPDDDFVHIGSRNSKSSQVFQRIVGGEEVDPFTWPWVAALYRVSSSGSNRFLCAGSLINENFVLTAAHCFTRDDMRSTSFVVMLGTHNAQDAVAQYLVSSVLQHPKYQQRYDYHDIALLRLQRHVAFNEYVMPVCLPSSDAPLLTDSDIEGKTVTVMGWGDESFGGKSSRVLKEATVKIVSRRTCNASYISVASNRFPRGITNDMLCAGDVNGGKDACQGDSGGPLTSIEHGRYTQVGIVSFGYQCGTKDYPGVYTKVAPYLSWIAENSHRARDSNDHEDYDY